MNCKLKDGILEAWRRHPRNQLISKYLQRRHFPHDRRHETRTSVTRQTDVLHAHSINSSFFQNKQAFDLQILETIFAIVH